MSERNDLRIKSSRIITPLSQKSGYVYVKNGKIVDITDKDLPFEREIDVGNDYVIAGVVDIHTHGAMGFDYASASVKEILEAVKFQVKSGATTVFPTITSSSYEKIYNALENIEEAMRDEKWGARIGGAHLEGPYFSPSQCGAQDKTYITEPKREEYKKIIDRFSDIIKRWDYAPERDENGEFCAYLTLHNVLPSAGHTDAKYEDMLTAQKNGCKLITHLYSCTSTITRNKGFRSLGVIECAYLFDDMNVEVIADGKHLPIELLSLVFKLKDADKIILVSDSLRVTGTQEKRSTVGEIECIIEDGVCKLADRSAFAGSIATAQTLLKTCLQTGKDMNFAVKTACENPAKLFGLNRGKIEKGFDADLLVLDSDANVKKVFVNGEEV
ncbi:MAG: N-acetylglucosamine-6-phosphate deacetylase [Clostridiales bacterium]|nr:N-acetylglucosamine-6-phosphate deacetylase [Clostridiales bacterium]